MNATLLGLAMTMGLTIGCAHGPLASNDRTQGRDLRGSARVGQQARVIVAGPALLVHAAGGKPVRWFVVDRASGTDSDCAAARSDRNPGRVPWTSRDDSAGLSPAPSTRSSRAPLAESTGVHLTIAPDHVLCASVAQGTTDVIWHQVVDATLNMWALR